MGDRLPGHSQISAGRRRVVAGLVQLLALGFASGCVPRFRPASGMTTTVVLIRHAERSMVTGALTPEGHARAAALVEALADLRIAAIYSPRIERNLDTVAPLARHLGLSVTEVDEKPDADTIAHRLLVDHPGDAVLWVGNTANLADIYYRLGGQGKAPDEYGDLFILTIRERADAQVERRHFGR